MDRLELWMQQAPLSHPEICLTPLGQQLWLLVSRVPIGLEGSSKLLVLLCT